VKALQNYGFQVVREQCLVNHTSGERSWFDRAQDFRSSVRSLEPALEPSALALPLIGGDARFSAIVAVLSRLRGYTIEPAKLRDMQDPDGGTSLRKDGSNAASVLQEIGRQSPAELDRIGEILKTIVPNTGEVRVKKHGNKLALEFTQEWEDERSSADREPRRLHFEAFNMSDGTLRALGLLTAVFQKPAPSVLAIEEPEATIHPGALGAILDVVSLATTKMQVVVTTHSPEVLDAKWIRPEHLRVVEWRSGATRVSVVSDVTKRALQEHVMGAGDMLRSDTLRAEPLFEDVESPVIPDLFEQVVS
jgi:predicted ATPase